MSSRAPRPLRTSAPLFESLESRLLFTATPVAPPPTAHRDLLTINADSARAAITFTPAAPTLALGQTLSLTATLSSDAGTATGQLLLLDGSRFLAAAALHNAAASFAIPRLALGTHNLHAFFISADHASIQNATALLTVFVHADRPAYGVVDIRAASLIGGVAADPDAATTYVRIDIDNKPTAVVAANATTHRFSYAPTNLRLGSHTIKVSVYNFPSNTLSTLAAFSILNRAATAAIHSLDATAITGLASDPDSPSTPVTLVLQIDNRPAVILTANQTLTGLPANHAFTYTLPTLTPGTHHLTLMALDTSGAGITQHQTLTLTV